MKRRIGTFAAAIFLIVIGACQPQPQSARPALWEVTGPNGEQGWLFGTIHSLDRPAQWRTPPVDKALAGADRVVVEVANVSDGAALAEVFTRLSRTPGLPPLTDRVEPAARPALETLLKRAGLKANGFTDMETWAAALTLAQAEQDADGARNGIDRAVLAAARGKPVVELEGAAAQLGIFDGLPEKEQRDLLAIVIADSGALDRESADLAEAWRTGDFAVIERETRTGLLADPELRQALFTARNTAWTGRIADMLQNRARPFVAVGAAHMAGPDGLVAMLAERGYGVRRIQ
ncbi:MAG: TraB/GumN family protein [Novosphingobium sp.]|nr:TraB/GumN family protein [Novosphingobium sp.]